MNNLLVLPLVFVLHLGVGMGITHAQSGASGDNRLEILKTARLLGGRGFDRLKEDVILKHKNSLIYCDSAHFYGQENLAKLFGRVKIVDQEDPIVVTSLYAEYDGNTQLAKLRNKVVFTNDGTVLYTDFLDYDRSTGEANYFNKGKVVDSTNVLTSEKGLYQTQLAKITFTENVVLDNPDYDMRSNILYYYTETKIAETEGITNVESTEGNKLNAKRGSFYDTENKLFKFYDGDVETETSKVYGEILMYDELNQYYEAIENVSIYNKEREIEVFGHEGKYWEESQYSKVYGNALVRKYFEQDTLFMIADTLISQDSEDPDQRFLLAFPNMRMIKSELAGRSDSMSYRYADSTIYLFGDPVMWNNRSQITADSIRILIANQDIDRALLRGNAFAITKDTVTNYNQIKGRKMTGYFIDGDMSKLDVEGNGESLYFALENDTTLRGINKLLCGRIIMHFANNQVSKISHTLKPEASFTPPHMIKDDQKALKGFSWREDERPSMSIINDWRTPKIREEDTFNFFDQPDVQLSYPDNDEIQKSLDDPIP
ncbi:MAG: organic solvent tolerance protein OstA [Lunatimonas sp.]|uniref:OstA-like protein n=1 Tax=Lunatimonas sp. TaxID=2060141 RepID=UPI00263AB820|nr:OstA-like protein [Lunatimonas sp.]MCC5935963.1 organic solvent tolerance protein OstA [Lunatimonas sp.]